jgi:hypothetical protein
VAAQVGLYSPVQPETLGNLNTLDLATGTKSRDDFRGVGSTWWNDSGSYWAAYNASQTNAYNGCSSVYAGGQCSNGNHTGSNGLSCTTTSYTSCSPGAYTGTTCTTTITVRCN